MTPHEATAREIVREAKLNGRLPATLNFDAFAEIDIASALALAEKRGMEKAAEIAESDKYVMFLTHADIERGELLSDTIYKIREQARKEVAKAIRQAAQETTT